MEEVKLNGSWTSPFLYRVIWALKYKGVDYECQEEDLFIKSESLLGYNPAHRKIPILVHGGKPIPESAVILKYIEEKWPHNPLLPQDPYDKALARFLIKFGEEKVSTCFLIYRTSGEMQEKAVHKAKQVLKIIEEQALGEKKFFGGDAIGMVDIAFGWIADWLHVLQEVGGVEVFEPHTFPRLHAWIQSFKQVPTIEDNFPDRGAILASVERIRESILTPATK